MQYFTQSLELWVTGPMHLPDDDTSVYKQDNKQQNM